jgi:hypothetical protein
VYVRRLIPIVLLLGPAGCSSEDAALAEDRRDYRVELGAQFDASRSGRVSGQVTWSGPVPNPPAFQYVRPRPNGEGFEVRSVANPNRPRVEPKSRAVRGCVVFLRGVNPATSRVWDLPSVSVEIGGEGITVVQGDRRGRVGFVRVGESIAVTSTESAYHVLRGRGDAFFSLPLTESNRPTPRLLSKIGRVELSSGTGLYWAHANLFVTDNPYYAVTDADGRFAFEHVPADNVEVVAWLPDWRPARTERDPDSIQVVRQWYGPPIERTATKSVEPARTVEVNLILP